MLSALLRCKTSVRMQKINCALVRYTGRYREQKNKSLLLYVSAFTIFVGGCSYAAVPLYRLFCQSTGRGGRAVAEELGDKMIGLKKVAHRQIRVTFNADTASGLRWNFKPRQNHVTVYPGETVLAFYSAKNPGDEPVDGIATYNILPFEAGKYFNKIQCFCFEEQRLNPHEEVDMPVFFYIDPEYAEDPRLEQVDDLTLSYTFFEAKEGLKLPVPTIR